MTEPKEYIDLTEQVDERNPSHIPMMQCNYYLWMKSKQLRDIHAIYTRRAYLEEQFGFIRGVHRIDQDVINNLKAIEDWYFTNEVANKK